MEAGRPRPAWELSVGSYRLTGRPFDQLRLTKGGPTPCDNLQSRFFRLFGVYFFAFGKSLASEKQ